MWSVSARPRAGLLAGLGGRTVFQRFLHQLKPGLNFTPNFWRADALCAGPPQVCPWGHPSGMLSAGSGAGFFSSVTQAVSAADSLQPRTRAAASSRFAAWLPAERSRSGGFNTKRSHPAGCGQGLLAAEDAVAGYAPREDRRRAFLL